MPRSAVHKAFIILSTLIFCTAFCFQIINFWQFPSGFMLYSVLGVLGFGFLSGFSLFLTANLFSKPQLFEDLYFRRFVNWIEQSGHLLICFLSAVWFIFLMGFSAVMFLSRLAKYLGDWVSIFYRIQPVYWAVFVFLSLFLVWMFLNYSPKIISRKFWVFDTILNTFLLLLIFSFTLMQWGDSFLSGSDL